MSTQAIATDNAVASSSSAISESKAKRYGLIAARVVLGLVFFVFGLNGFFNFIPPPPNGIPEGAAALAGAMMKSGYLFQLVKGTEVIVGVLLLSNRLRPAGAGSHRTGDREHRRLPRVPCAVGARDPARHPRAGADARVVASQGLRADAEGTLSRAFASLPRSV